VTGLTAPLGPPPPARARRQPGGPEL